MKMKILVYQKGGKKHTNGLRCQKFLEERGKSEKEKIFANFGTINVYKDGERIEYVQTTCIVENNFHFIYFFFQEFNILIFN